jgi:hypothetical protein
MRSVFRSTGGFARLTVLAAAVAAGVALPMTGMAAGTASAATAAPAHVTVYRTGDVMSTMDPTPTFLHTGIYLNYKQLYTVWAHLSNSDWDPIDDASIMFVVHGHICVCTATTNSDGYASCNLDYQDSLLINLNDGTWVAAYAGDCDYDPSYALGQGIT